MRNIVIVAASIACGLVVSAPAGAQSRVYVVRPLGGSAPSFEAPTERVWGKSLTEVPSKTAGRTTPSSLVSVDSTRRAIRTCPMPVLVPDTARLERIRVIVSDTLRRDPMPVAKLECSNPLQP